MFLDQSEVFLATAVHVVGVGWAEIDGAPVPHPKFALRNSEVDECCIAPGQLERPETQQLDYI